MVTGMSRARVMELLGRVQPVRGRLERAVISQTKAGLSLMIAMALFATLPVTIEPVTDLIPYVLQERVYFFHLDGAVPGTVVLVNTPDLGWRFSEALGVGNEPLPEQTIDRLHSLFNHRES